MSVVSIQRNFNNIPQIVNMEVTDTQATIAATGWLALPATIASIELANNGLWVWQPGDLVLVYSDADNSDSLYQVNLTTNSFTLYSTAGNGAVTLPVVSGDFTVFDGTAGALKDAGFLPSDATKTNVVMAGSAVVVNHIAKFIDTAGTVDDTAGTAINSGTIQSGLPGTVGGFIAYPPTAANGFLELLAINAGAAFNTVISNSIMGQTSTISIPDPGVAASKFLLTDSASSQTIATGSLLLSLGTLTLGSSGHPSSLIIFPPTAANGTLILAAANAGAAFNTTISNGSMAQSTVYTIPDIGAATGDIVVSTAAVRLKSVAAAAAAGGAAAQSFTDTFSTTGSVILGQWVTQTNPGEVVKIVPGNGSFVVTSTADIGVGTFSYIIMK